MADAATELIPPQGFHLVDAIILVAVLIGAIQGLRHGLSGELAHVISVAAMLLVGWRALAPLSALITEFTRLNDTYARPVAFVGACVVVLLAMSLLRTILKGVMELHIKPGFDRWGGLIAGAVKFGAIAAAVLYLMMMSPSEYLVRLASHESAVGRALREHLPVVQDQLDRFGDGAQEEDPDGEHDPPATGRRPR
ncbi:MAG: CvpA family protein [Verrucomicrobia bacterium]|nr:CvpA family protein [Verrucomicrobiota bacterium]MDA1085830.1 CvpA family protein [Verrucomicrobiota bacterium]